MQHQLDFQKVKRLEKRVTSPCLEKKVNVWYCEYESWQSRFTRIPVAVVWKHCFYPLADLSHDTLVIEQIAAQVLLQMLYSHHFLPFTLPCRTFIGIVAFGTFGCVEITLLCCSTLIQTVNKCYKNCMRRKQQMCEEFVSVVSLVILENHDLLDALDSSNSLSSNKI